MADIALRLGLVLGVIVVAVGLAYAARRRVTYHPPLNLDGVDLGPGLVVFTSTECRRCKEVLAVAKATGAPLREVTYELEAPLQEKVGVKGVPLTLVIGPSGGLLAQFAGPVQPRRLRRALAGSGI